jgi:hypothetical protein
MSDRRWDELRDRSLAGDEPALGSDHAGYRDLYLLLLGTATISPLCAAPRDVTRQPGEGNRHRRIEPLSSRSRCP